MAFWQITITVLVIMGGNLLLRSGILAAQSNSPPPQPLLASLGGTLRTWRAICGLLLVFLGVIGWIVTVILFRMEWSYVALGLSYVATVLFAWWFMGETLTLEKMFGAIIIVIGTLLIVRNGGF